MDKKLDNVQNYLFIKFSNSLISCISQYLKGLPFPKISPAAYLKLVYSSFSQKIAL